MVEGGDITISQCSMLIYRDSNPGVEIPVSTATASKGLCGKKKPQFSTLVLMSLPSFLSTVECQLQALHLDTKVYMV